MKAALEEEEEEAKPREDLVAPMDGVERTQSIDDFVFKLQEEMQRVSAAQKEHARAIGKISELLELVSGSPDLPVAAACPDAEWVGSLGNELDVWPDASSEADVSTQYAIKDALGAFKEQNLKAASDRARAYAAAHAAHEDLTKTKAKKGKEAASQQKEAEALSKAQTAMQVTTGQLRVLDEDYRVALLNAMRALLHGQLSLHAKGLETFTRAMQQLPNPPPPAAQQGRFMPAAPPQYATGAPAPSS